MPEKTPRFNWRQVLHNIMVTARRDIAKGKKRDKEKKRVVRGKDISVTQSAAPGQVIYGRTKIGGIYTYLDTSDDSHAYIVLGTANAQVAFQAKQGGTIGNSITIEFKVSGTQSSTVVESVTDKAIVVRLKSTSGSSNGTASQVVTAIRANPLASALVNANLAEGNGTGIPIAQIPTALQGGGGTWLYSVITVAAHEIDAIEKVYLNNKEVTLGAAADARWGTGIWNQKLFVHTQFGTDTQEAIPDLQSQRPSFWSANHRQAGCASAFMINIWNQNTYADGMPEATFLIRGKKCYDPRSGLTAWTDNAALCIADFIVNSKFGMAASYADFGNLSQAADDCDVAATGLSKRYTINCAFDTSLSPAQVLQEMSAAIGGGDITYQAGKWYIFPAIWRAPVLSLTEADLVGPLEVTTHISRSESFNAVRGTFVDKNNDYNEGDFPEVTNSFYESQDGIRIYEDLALTMVDDPTRAYYIARQELERVRQGITINAQFSLKALQLMTSDNFTFTVVRLGWASKVFETREISIAEQPNGQTICNVTARETAQANFDFTNQPTLSDPAPNTNLPDPSSVSLPTSVVLTSGTSELYFRNDGTVFSRIKVSWDLNASIFVQQGGEIECQYKQSATGVWSQTFKVNGDMTFLHILDVQDGQQYDVRIRAVNSIGYASDWVTVLNHLVVGKTALPSNVTGFTATVGDTGILLTWNGIPDIDRAEYEVRVGSAWASGVSIVRLRAEGTSYLYSSLAVGAYRFMVKAIDTSANFSAQEAVTSVSIGTPNPVQGLKVDAIGSTININWQAPIPGALSITSYKIWKGDTFAGAAFIGTSDGTFYTVLETESGNATYWVTAVDSGGNESAEKSILINVQPTNDFLLIADITLSNSEYESGLFAIQGGSAAASGESANVAFFPIGKQVLGSSTLLPEAWEGDTSLFASWLAAHSYADFAASLAGLPTIPFAPNPHWPGYIQWKKDFGSVQPNSFITFGYLRLNWGDDITIVPTISTSPDNSTWTDYPATTQLFASGFRYVRARLDFKADTPYSIVKIVKAFLRLQLKQEDEVGSVSCVSTDAGGTTVTFSKNFAKVSDIQVSTVGTTFGSPVYDFNFSTSNPTTFKVLLFDAAGARINGTVRYRARGAING